MQGFRKFLLLYNLFFLTIQVLALFTVECIIKKNVGELFFTGLTKNRTYPTFPPPLGGGWKIRPRLKEATKGIQQQNKGTAGN